MKHLSSPTVDQTQAPRKPEKNPKPLEQRIAECVDDARAQSRYEFSSRDLLRDFSDSDVTDRDAGLCPDPLGDLSDK